MSRCIRLREHAPRKNTTIKPDLSYLNTCDNTILSQDYIIRTDLNGFIIGSLDDEEADRPIIYLGDSVVENMFVDEDERATVCISRYLRDAGHSVPVRNAGVTGATTLDLYQLLVAKCLPLRPRGIILTSGMMDIVRMSSGKSFWEGLIEPADALDCPNILGEAESYDGLNATRNSILQLFHSTCTQFNIPFLLTTWGFTPRMRTCAGVKTLGSDYCDWLGRALQINDATRHIAEQSGIYFVDLAEQMQDKDIFYYDGLHPNGRGCKKIGDLIGPELSKILDSKLWF